MERSRKPEIGGTHGGERGGDEKGKGHHRKIENAVQMKEINKGDWNAYRIVAKGNHF